LDAHHKERIDLLEENMKEQLCMCNKLCVSKIDFIEKTANKAHDRLDRQSESIKCIIDWKNQMKGRMWAIPFIIAPVSAAITAIIIKTFTK